MQRLGYLKRLVKRATTTSTSNLDNLGHDLLDAVTRKVRTPLDEHLAVYIKVRLFDNAYVTIKQQADGWLKNGGEPPVVAIELQDLYLADVQVSSGVGKLVREDWRKYPPLATSLGLVREGTYSANTRALSLLYFTPETELRAFQEYLPEANPLRLTQRQALLLLYALIENDGEVLVPLWNQLAARHADGFNDRDAGNLLGNLPWPSFHTPHPSLAGRPARPAPGLGKIRRQHRATSQSEKYAVHARNHHAGSAEPLRRYRPVSQA